MKIRSCKIRVGTNEHVIRFDRPHLPLADNGVWQRLKYHKCTHCSLDDQEDNNCPIANDIADTVIYFSNIFSYEITYVTVMYDDFEMGFVTSAQDICFSLLLYIIVSSKCPIFIKYSLILDNTLIMRNIDDIFMHFIVTFCANRIMADGKIPDKSEIRHELSLLEEVIESVKFRVLNFNIKDSNANAFARLLQVGYIFDDDLDEFITQIKQKLFSQ